jgi:hypothetical protein
MSKPLVVLIEDGLDTYVHFIGDVDVISVNNRCDDRIYRMSPTRASDEALRHFIGPRKFWGDIQHFAPVDPKGKARWNAAFDPDHRLSLYPGGSPLLEVRAKRAEAQLVEDEKVLPPRMSRSRMPRASDV